MKPERRPTAASILILALTAVAAAILAGGARWASGTSFTQQGGSAPGVYNWHALAAGASAEWVFTYPGNDDRAVIAFGADPAGSIAVDVYDNDQWRALGAGDASIVPVGRGSPGPLAGSDANDPVLQAGTLFWEARARPPVTFHVRVANRSQRPAQYWIAQTGPGAGGLTLAVAPVRPAGTEIAQPQIVRAGAGPAPAPQTLPVTGAEGPALARPWALSALERPLQIAPLDSRLRGNDQSR